MQLNSDPPKARTRGQLGQSGYRPCTVKEELRRNVLERLRNKTPLFPGMTGYDETVIPEIINGILSRHDMLFLGLRGQAKTRMIRMLPNLLDEWIPVLADSELPDDPIQPRLSMGKRIVAEQGDEALIRWMHRSERFHEKLATPDVTIADLIGEIDLVRHAQGRFLSDESTMHFGLIPRTNRGIFAMNELPDLAPKIQVGLFNVLEERDVQIRGYPIRLDLDISMVFSANPEDYTNRGRIVTPLKDRIGSAIRTHYPLNIRDAIQITQDHAWVARDGGVTVNIPPYMFEILEEFVRLARNSPHINQASGVSVRCSITNAENLVSSAERRALLCGESQVTTRMDDLAFVKASSRGKIELMLAEGDTAEDKLISSVLGEAVKGIFNKVADPADFEDLIDQFKSGLTLEVGDDVSTATMVENFGLVKGMKSAVHKLCREMELATTDGNVASVGEFLLEALYVNNRLSKASTRGKHFFRK